MSRRLNMWGFSLAKMRGLLGSRDRAAVQQLQYRLAEKYGYLPEEQRKAIDGSVERAVMEGVPFRELEAENFCHSVAAELLSTHGQELLFTDASDYHGTALEDGLWGQYRKHAGPETRAFLRGLMEGIPLFGSRAPTDGSAYAAISLAKLRGIQRGLRDLAEQIAYRVGRKQLASSDDKAGVEFADAFCGWVDQIVKAERDLWSVFA
ncbi:MAG TPA: hypothetical protein VMS17_20425 [Gemmataceae bacterium]|nr:hypothetical protein [Gemmataceae bacterium]